MKFDWLIYNSWQLHKNHIDASFLSLLFGGRGFIINKYTMNIRAYF